MFIVWRNRPVIGNDRTPFLREPKSTDYERTPWKPLYCEHRGAGRCAWTPLVMHSERRDGKPRQRVLERLPSIRSCCIADGFNRAAWWHDIGFTFETIPEWADGPMYEHLSRDKADMMAKLRAVVPSPTPAGLRDFTVYRLAKEAERKARNAADWAYWKEKQAESERGDREQRSRDQARGFEEAFREAMKGAATPGSFAVLGLPPDASPAQIKARYRELAKQHHPDRGGDAAEFARINEAYEAAHGHATRR